MVPGGESTTSFTTRCTHRQQKHALLSPPVSSGSPATQHTMRYEYESLLSVSQLDFVAPATSRGPRASLWLLTVHVPHLTRIPLARRSRRHHCARHSHTHHYSRRRTHARTAHAAPLHPVLVALLSSCLLSSPPSPCRSSFPLRSGGAASSAPSASAPRSELDTSCPPLSPSCRRGDKERATPMDGMSSPTLCTCDAQPLARDRPRAAPRRCRRPSHPIHDRSF